MSQNEICLKHMRRHGSLTTLVAFDKYDKAYSLAEEKRARAAA